MIILFTEGFITGGFSIGVSWVAGCSIMEHLKQDFTYAHIFRGVLAEVRYSSFTHIPLFCSTALYIRSTCKALYSWNLIRKFFVVFKILLNDFVNNWVTICKRHGEKVLFFLVKIAHNYFTITLISYSYLFRFRL